MEMIEIGLAFAVAYLVKAVAYPKSGETNILDQFRVFLYKGFERIFNRSNIIS